MGNGHLPLGFHPVNLQIPRLPYPHNKGKPQVQRLRKESLGGIPAVKQQQTAGQTKFRQPLHMPDGKIALIRGIGRQLTVILCTLLVATTGFVPALAWNKSLLFW